MVRKPERHLITACLAALVAVGLAASCTEGEGLPATTGDDAPSITFTTPQTRAAVTGADDMDAFSVWAWKDDGKKVFPVSPLRVYAEGGSWEYDPQYLTRWEEDKMYDFYALYPEQSVIEQNGSTTVSCDENGTITITNYNATNELDLMTATVSDRPGAEGGKVGFTFEHLLANIVFEARTAPAVAGQGITMTITSFRLTGFPVTATYSSATTPRWSVSNPQNERYNSTEDIPLNAVDNAYSPVADLLVFPQQLGQSLRYEVTYTSSDGGTEYTRSGRISDISGDLVRWQPGVRYRYAMELGADYILFSRPEVEEWQEISGGRWTVE